MKFSHFLLAAALCSAGTASAQTTPSQTPRGTGSAAPSAVPSGTAPATSNPKGAVSAGEVFTTGSPDGTKRSPKHSQDKAAKSDSHGKTKPKM